MYNPPKYVRDVWIASGRAYITIKRCRRHHILPDFMSSGFDRCKVGLHVVDISDSRFTSTPVSCYQGALAELIARCVPRKTPVSTVSIVEDSFTSPSGWLRDVLVSGDYVYLEDVDKGVRVLDITDPTNPVEVKFHDSAKLRRMAMVDHRYVHVFDPTTSTEVVFAMAFDMLGDVTIVDKYAYIAAYDNGLRILDISNPASPIEVGCYNPGRVNRATVIGDYAYIIVDDDTPGVSSGMHIVDVSNPSSPTKISFCQVGRSPQQLAVSDGYAYVGEWYGLLKIVDVSDPYHPALVATYIAGDRIDEIVIVNRYAYIAAQTAGLKIVDISKPARPTEVGHYDTYFASGVAVKDQYIYLSDLRNGLSILRFAP